MKNAEECRKLFVMRTEDFEELYRELYPFVRRYLSWRVSDGETADDMAQEIFAKVWKHRQSFEGKCSLKTWVMRIAANHLKDYYKSKRPDMTDDSHLSVICSDDDIETAYQAKCKLSVVQRIIKSMPLSYREPFVLIRFDNLSYREAADVLSISVSLVKVRVHRAHMMLTDAMRGEEI
ncbi:MAG: RNA polymerase sigma factor [Deferribacterales bacterium]